MLAIATQRGHVGVVAGFRVDTEEVMRTEIERVRGGKLVHPLHTRTVLVRDIVLGAYAFGLRRRHRQPF
jgi:hypothetical protein